MNERTYQLQSGNAVYETGQGPGLVVIPGGPGLSSELYRHYLRPLAQNFRVFFWDYGSVGNSAPRARHSFAQDYQDFLTLIGTLNAIPVHVLAHSYGGCLALKFACEKPEQLKSLILIGTTPRFTPVLQGMAQRKMQVFSADQLQSVGVILERVQEGLLTEADTHLFCEIESHCQFYKPSASTTSLFAQHCGLKMDVLMQNQDWTALDFTNELTQIQAPSLVVTSERDIIVPAQFSQAFHALPHAQFQSVPASGHWPFAEQSDLFFKRCSQFLKL